MIHDDYMPDDDNLAPELDRYHYLASKGQIVRNGVVYDAERDMFTRTALLAQVRELYGLLHVVTAERDRLQQELEAVVSVQRTTVALAERAFAECDRLTLERDFAEFTLAQQSRTMQ